MKRSLVTLALTLLVALPSLARAQTSPEREEFIAGVTLSSLGGAGVIVAGVGSFAYIAETEHTGLWGWMALLSGGLTLGGGITLAHSEDKGEIPGTVAIIGGVYSMALGLIGLSLQTPEAKRRNARWRLSPLLGTTPSGERVAMFGAYGVF